MAKSGESPWVEQLDEDRIVYEAAAVLRDTEALVEKVRMERMRIRDDQVLEIAMAGEHQRQVWRNIGVVGLACIGATFGVAFHHF